MTGNVPGTHNRASRGRLIDTLFLMLGLAILMFVTTRSALVMDEDIWWHIRVGRSILETGKVPLVDTFSSHAPGQEWLAYSWLFEVLVTKLYQAAGYFGILALITAGGLAVTSWLIVFLCRWMNLRRAMILGFAVYLTLMPLKYPRPWLFTIWFFAIEITCLWIACERNKPSWLIPVLPLIVVWANMHIQFVYGLGVIGLFALEQSIPRKMRSTLSADSAPALPRRWMWILLTASFLGTLCNPYGWSLYRVVWQYSAQKAAVLYIQDLQAMPFRQVWNWIALLLIGAAVFTLGASRRKNLLLILLLAVSCYFGFHTQRDIWFPVTIAALTLGWELRSEPAAFERSQTIWPVAVPLSLVLCLFLLRISPQFSDKSLADAVRDHYPEQACAYIEVHNLKGPLFNSYDWGGYLMWRLPQMPVSIDGRGPMSEDVFSTAVNTISGRKTWSEDPDLKKAQTIVLESNIALTSILRVDPRYRLLYEDKTAVVFARNSLTPATMASVTSKVPPAVAQWAGAISTIR